MLVMAERKRPKKPAASEPADEFQTPFRPDDRRIIEALDRFAKATHRSRNGAMNFLIAEGLRAAGYWPVDR